MLSPAVGSMGWLGLGRDWVPLGMSSHGGWHWALGCPVCAAMGRRRNVGPALLGHWTLVTFRARVLPLPFPTWVSQGSRGQERGLGSAVTGPPRLPRKKGVSPTISTIKVGLDKRW